MAALHYFSLVSITLLLSCNTFAQQEMSVAECELEFAQTARNEGIKSAFERYMSPKGSIIVGNTIVNALTYYKKVSDDNRGLLWWKPTDVFTNEQQDFGFATGPFRYFEQDNEKPVAAGNTFSIWEKEDDGIFRILFDGGILLQEIPTIAINELEKREIREHKLYTNPGNSTSLPSLHVATPPPTHPKAILLRPNQDGTVARERAFLMPALSKRIKNEGFDRKGKFYYRYGNLVMDHDHEASSLGGICGYFAQVWMLSSAGWILVADVMQYH